MRNRLLAILILFAIVTLNSCKDDEKIPANVIESSDGVTIELTWLTDGTPTQALDDADVDLEMYDSDNFEVASSTSSFSFEEILLSDDYDDDTYTIKVLLYENNAGKAISFTVKVSDDDKSIETDGSFLSSVVDGTSYSVIKIKKNGNKYTVTEL